MGEESQASRPLYDRLHVEMSNAIGRAYNNPLGRYAIDQIHQLAPFRPGDRVLDIGAGRGTTAIDLAGTYGLAVTGTIHSKASSCAGGSE